MRNSLIMTCLAVLATAGCDSVVAVHDPLDPVLPLDPSQPIPVTGHWTSLFASGAFLELVLREEADGSIVGSGNVRFAPRDTTSAISVVVVGDVVFPRVSIVLRSTGFQDINISGSWLSTRLIQGRIHGGGFHNVPIRLERRQATAAPLPALVPRP